MARYQANLQVVALAEKEPVTISLYWYYLEAAMRTKLTFAHGIPLSQIMQQGFCRLRQ